MKKKGEKTVIIFSLASFLNDLGSDMISPVWPLFVAYFLRANMAILGFIDGLGDSIVSISQAISGYLSDRLRKRKIFIWSGYFLASISRVGYSVSTTWQHLVPFKIMDRLGKMRDPPRDAIIADVTKKKVRGGGFGLLTAMDNLGAVFGIISCIVLFGILGYKKLFFLASIPSLLSVLLILIFIREPKVRRKLHKGLSLRDINLDFKLFLFSSIVFSLGFFSYSFLLVYAREFGFQEYWIPFLYLIFTLIASIASLPFGRLSDKVGRKFVLIFSGILFLMVCIGFIFVNSFLVMIVLFVIYGLHLGARVPVQTTFVSELSKPRYRASSLGIFKMVTGLCKLPASMIAGMLWVNFGKEMPFLLSSVLTAISVITLLFIKEH
jgi:MFS family permease